MSPFAPRKNAFSAIEPRQPGAFEQFLFDPETSVRRALILALGEYDEGQFPKAERELVAPKLLALYRDDPDAGIHGACEWLLRRWLQAPALAAIDAEMISLSAQGARRWYVSSQGQTLAVVAGPVEFRMGDPAEETDLATYVGHDASRVRRIPRSYEASHVRRIGRSFAVATKEVTWREFTGLVKTAQFSYNPHHVDPDDPDDPVREVSWYDAAHYCNRLSEKVGLSAEQWCYEPNEKGEYAAGMKPAGNYLKRAGYRLPTEAEWEFACRAGAASDYCFGDDPTLLKYYAWYDVSAKLDAQSLDDLGGRLRTDAGLLGVLEAWEHSHGGEKRVGRLKPNDLGLFDMHGNIMEWCDSPYAPYSNVGETAVDDVGSLEVLADDDDNARVLRGGTFNGDPQDTRSGKRLWNDPSCPRGSHIYGFRVARTYP